MTAFGRVIRFAKDRECGISPAAWQLIGASLISLILFPCSADEKPVVAAVNGDPTANANEATVRASVERSLPFLSSQGSAWMEERGCMSCHHVPFQIWTHRAALAKGLSVDEEKLVQWEKWAIKNSLEQRNLFRLQEYELGKQDEATLPTVIREKIKPLVDMPFKSAEEFHTALAAKLTTEELNTHELTLTKVAERAINAPDRTGGGLDALSQLLLAGHGTRSELSKPEFRDGVIQLIQQLQQPEGAWVPGNQFQTMRQWKEPVANQATTMWTTIAMAEVASPNDDPRRTLEKSIQWQLSQVPAMDNHEWLAIQVLFQHCVGTERDTEKARRQLADSRNSDGGWGWQTGAASDPYTTGLAVYVLARTSPAQAAAEIQGGRDFLIRTQQQDGSWITASKTISNTSDPERLQARDEIYHYWGTAWATLGLLESLRSDTAGR